MVNTQSPPPTHLAQFLCCAQFVISLPWLYSPLVWCVYNLVFQMIGNWQLLVGLIIMAYGPVMAFLIGVWKDITRPMPDKDIHTIRLMCDWSNRLKTGVGMAFVLWGLWAYAFEENAKYTAGYKEHLLKEFTTRSMLELGADIITKYYYTGLVGVDYMLSQIMNSRKYEISMKMASKSTMWASSHAAKKAAELKRSYMHLMNSFVRMTGLSTADIPEFANYRARKLKMTKRGVPAKRRKKKNRSARRGKRGGDKSESDGAKSLKRQLEEEEEGGEDQYGKTRQHELDNDGGIEMTAKFRQEDYYSEGSSEEASEEDDEDMQIHSNPLRSNQTSDWEVALDSKSGNYYKYNTATAEVLWVSDEENEKLRNEGRI